MQPCLCVFCFDMFFGPPISGLGGCHLPPFHTTVDNSYSFQKCVTVKYEICISASNRGIKWFYNRFIRYRLYKQITSSSSLVPQRRPFYSFPVAVRPASRHRLCLRLRIKSWNWIFLIIPLLPPPSWDAGCVSLIGCETSNLTWLFWILAEVRGV